MIMDTLTPLERSERMGRIKHRDTKPEMIVRRLAHSMGYRYRLQGREIPGRPDIVIRNKKKAIFVHGCFWHRHPHCRHARIPKTRQGFWVPKLEGNRTRDLRNQAELTNAGWKYLLIWECEIKNKAALQIKLRQFMEDSE